MGKKNMQPDLEQVKKKIQENRDLIDRITMKLPGFTGYVEKTELYDADRVIRGLLEDKLKEFKGALMAFSGERVRKGDHSLLAEIERQSNLLERFIKKANSGDSGSTAGLSHMKISDEDRNRLLEYDWRLLSSLDEISALVDVLKGASEGDAAKALGDLIAKIAVLEKNFNERKNVLLEVI